MDIDTILSIFGLSLSVGGLIPVLFFQNKIRTISISLVLISLVIISSIFIYNDYKHSEQISFLSNEIIFQVNKRILTFDQLYEKLYYEKQSDLNEALVELVKSGRLKHKVIELRDDYGESYRVRGYFTEL